MQKINLKCFKLSDYTLFPLYFLSFLGVWHIFVGGIYFVFPSFYFELFNFEFPLYLIIWKYYALIYICFGISFIISSYNPARFWPTLLVGFLFKLCASIVFLFHYTEYSYLVSFMPDIIVNHLNKMQ